MSLLDEVRASLATESPRLTISPRRRLVPAAQSVSVPAGGTAQIISQVSLNDILVPGSGLLVDEFGSQVGPNNGTAGLELTDIQALALDANNLAFWTLGQPIVSTLQPRSLTFVSFVLPLLLFEDFATFHGLPLPQPIKLGVLFQIANASGAAIVSIARPWLMYRLVSGIEDG